MTLTPADMMAIRAAIDSYEKRFPRRQSPSAAEALAWQAGKRGLTSRGSQRPAGNLSGECGPWSWACERFLLWWQVAVAPRIHRVT